MEAQIVGIIVVFAIALGLFFALRQVNNWYWKINERVLLQQKTNFLLEKIALQLGATNLDEITIEEISTGKRRKVKMDAWIEFGNNPNAKNFRIVNDELNHVE